MGGDGLEHPPAGDTQGAGGSGIAHSLPQGGALRQPRGQSPVEIVPRPGAVHAVHREGRLKIARLPGGADVRPLAAQSDDNIPAAQLPQTAAQRLRLPLGQAGQRPRLPQIGGDHIGQGQGTLG